MSSSFPDQRGARLRYQYWEDSSGGYDGVALVLHGSGCHSGSYPGLVLALVKARYKVYAPDFAGFGASPGERGAGGTLAMADAAEALYRRIEAVEGAREVDIVAHSMGAVAALLFLKRYPARRTRLAAVAPLLFGAPAGEASLPAALAADLDAAAKALLADPSFLEGRRAAFFAGEEDPLVPIERLTQAVDGLPLEGTRIVTFPRGGHDFIAGDGAPVAMEALLAWLGEARPER